MANALPRPGVDARRLRPATGKPEPEPDRLSASRSMPASAPYPPLLASGPGGLCRVDNRSHGGMMDQPMEGYLASVWELRVNYASTHPLVLGG
jgi:hypothetical protein